MNKTANGCLINGAGLYTGALKIYSIIESSVLCFFILTGLTLWYYAKLKGLVYLRNRNPASPLLIGISILALTIHSPIARSIEEDSFLAYCAVGNATYLICPTLLIVAFVIEIYSFNNKATLRIKLAKQDSIKPDVSNLSWFLASWKSSTLFGIVLCSIVFGVVIGITISTCTPDDEGNCTLVDASNDVSYILVLSIFFLLMLQTFYIYKKLKTFPDPFNILLDIKRATIAIFVLYFLIGIILFLTVNAELKDKFENNEEITFSPAVFGNIPLYFTFGYLVIYPAIKSFKFKATVGIFKEFSLARVLEDPTGYELFKTYLIYEFTLENLIFLDEVKELRCLENVVEVSNKIRRIYIAFIQNKRLNLPSEIYDDLEHSYRNGNFDKNFFDEAYCEVYQMVELDSFSRFKVSKPFKTYVGLRRVSTKAIDRDQAD